MKVLVLERKSLLTGQYGTLTVGASLAKVFAKALQTTRLVFVGFEKFFIVHFDFVFISFNLLVTHQTSIAVFVVVLVLELDSRLIRRDTFRATVTLFAKQFGVTFDTMGLAFVIAINLFIMQAFFAMNALKT